LAILIGSQSKAPKRDAKIKDRLFPGEPVFDARRRGFVPLVIALLGAQHLFSPRGWQIYTALLMRTGKAGVAWPTVAELSYELAFKSHPKIRKYLAGLEENGWIRSEQSGATRYFLVRDPLVVLAEKKRDGTISGERLSSLEDIMDRLRLPQIAGADPGEGTASGGDGQGAQSEASADAPAKPSEPQSESAAPAIPTKPTKPGK
jgi:hypothetical protein